MRIKINMRMVIRQPPPQVFDRLTDVGKWPQWGGNVVSMEQLSTGPMQVGSQIRQVTKMGRKPDESISIIEVTDFVPNQGFGFKGPYLKGLFTLDPVETGTQLNAQFEVLATGLMALVYKLLLKRFAMNDLRKFKKMVEATAGF